MDTRGQQRTVHTFENKKESREGDKDKIFQTFLDEEESTEYKRIDLKKAINKVETTNKETQESWKQAIEGKYGSRGLKYLLISTKIRQNKLLLRGRLQEIGIVQNGECIVCAQKATEEEKPIEDLRHIWRDCGIGREQKELVIEEIAEIIQDSTSGPELQLLHEIKKGSKDIKERKEEKQDPQMPDIPNTFMYAEREEVRMEGEEGVKAHNVIGGERKIDRSKKRR